VCVPATVPAAASGTSSKQQQQHLAEAAIVLTFSLQCRQPQQQQQQQQRRQRSLPEHWRPALWWDKHTLSSVMLHLFLTHHAGHLPVHLFDWRGNGELTFIHYPSLFLSQQVIEQELGLPWTEVFSSLSPCPVAAASLGQVYRGRLASNGAEVAVKVSQRLTVDC
jgi:hypothetical protein